MSPRGCKFSIQTTKGQWEAKLQTRGHKYIAGVDEVGRGCIAGPVIAGAAVLNYEKINLLPTKQLNLIRDSKKLSLVQREAIVPVIQELAYSFGIGSSSSEEIFRFGIVPATFLAMRRALAKLTSEPEIVLVDGKFTIPKIEGPQMAIVGGDGQTFAIAAASILAKVYRDRYMKQQAQKYPQWGFESHVGYGTQRHKALITKFGICPLHRRNFAPINTMFSPA